jgi:hypothetical protein
LPLQISPLERGGRWEVLDRILTNKNNAWCDKDYSHALSALRQAKTAIRLKTGYLGQKA